MVGDRYGIRWLPTYEQRRDRVIESDWMDPYYPNARILLDNEHPFPVANVMTFDTMYVETPRFMAWLTDEVLKAGGTIRIRRFESLADVATLTEKLIFNCTGIGAKQLVSDDVLTPVRGQLAVLRPQNEVHYAFAGNSGYMFPRLDGILLGGTFERDVWDTTPVPATIDRILRSHRDFFGSFRCTA